MKPCPICDGERYVYCDVPMRQTFGRDVGYIETRPFECEDCNGTGEVEDDLDLDE